MREKRHKFGESERRRWYPDVNVEISDDDWMIEQSSSVDESVNFIRSIVDAIISSQ